MRLIDRYICKEIFSHTLLGLVIFTFVLLVPKLVEIMELVVRNSGSPSRVGLLLICIFPGLLTFTLPMAVLVGVLIGLGRLSADSELIALSALGIGIRRVLVPVGFLATGMSLLTLVITLWIGPAAQRTVDRIKNELAASTASFEIKPRVFDELSANATLYVENVTAGATQWRGVFLAETEPDNSSNITLAEDAIVIPDREQGKLELHLHNGSEHESQPNDPNHYLVETFGKSDFPIELNGLGTESHPAMTNPERSLSELLSASGPRWREARVEIQRRFAFPVACFVFALLAVPLAARPRRGGRAVGFLVSLLLVCGYYLIFIIGLDLARRGILPPSIGVWAANILTGVAGLALLPGMEQIRSATWFSRLVDRCAAGLRNMSEAIRGGRRRETVPGRPEPVPNAKAQAIVARKTRDAEDTGDGKGRVIRLRPVRPLMRVRHNSGFPQRLDLYLLKNFCSYFLLVMAGFIFLFEIFTFFELLDDIARNHTGFFVVVNYFRFLVPFLFYRLAPFAVLVAAMVTLGIMSKNNEVVAIKASGVSLYRLAWPLIGASAMLAFGMLMLDNTYLPYFNQRQDELRAEIKGKPPQSHLRPNRSWIFDANDKTNDKIYNYQIFDPDNNSFGGLNVFELDRQTFQLQRRVYAKRAQWLPEQNTWLLKDGWVRDFDGPHPGHYQPFQDDTVAELNEQPSYFKREVPQADQMSWRTLETYIGEMRRAGFDVERLTVQWHIKLAFPMIAPIIAFLAIPFAFYVGTRGAIGGLAVGVGIGIVYWATSALFEALGGVGQLPPLLAAWAPDAIFIFFGAYFFLKMPT
jgi:LPS export ABC transporter permease LptG/LPS export ABC transporter permease LptF